MSAEAITIFPLLRPQFDDNHLGNESLWIFMNARALGRYWVDQSIVLGESPSSGLDTFDTWLAVQHDIEMALRGPIARLPHGAGVL